MIKFVLGFLTGAVLILLGLFCYVRFGFVDPRADLEPGSLEKMVAMPALDASVDKRVADMKNPIQPTDDNLMNGMKIYQANCAGCHGDTSHPHSPFGNSFYPRAPQFIEDAPDMTENQNFYIIQHGVRLSGMPAWKTMLKESEIWQLTTFLSNMSKLPPQVSAAWRAGSTRTESTDSAEPERRVRQRNKPVSDASSSRWPTTLPRIGIPRLSPGQDASVWRPPATSCNSIGLPDTSCAERIRSAPY